MLTLNTKENHKENLTPCDILENEFRLGASEPCRELAIQINVTPCHPLTREWGIGEDGGQQALEEPLHPLSP